MNEKEKRWDIFRILGMIVVSAFPVLVMVLAFSELRRGAIPTGQNLPFTVVIPVLTMLGGFFTIRSRRSGSVKWILCILILAVFWAAMMFFMISHEYDLIQSSTGEEAMENYRRAAAIHEVFPEPEELGQPETVEYHYFEGHGSIFTWGSKTLICGYSAEDYQEQLSWLEDYYVFQEEPVTSHGYTLAPEATVGEYEFRLLSFGEESYQLDYPQCLFFVGTNADAGEIVFLYYGDQDLDYIESLEKHILGYCGWSHIR